MRKSNMRQFTAFICSWLLIGTSALADAGNHGAWGDQGDGTFKNPILPGDFSDPDVVRVGGDYYLITSTFQYSPGVAVMHSEDLVNWRFLGHCVSDLTQIGPELNWDRMNRYNRGIYGGTLRHHDGRFWVFFTTPDEGVFMTTATNAAGPWEPLYRLWETKDWDDPCPFWDDDGQAYLLLSKPGDEWWTHLFKMSPDGKSINLKDDTILDRHRGSEGNKLYKINGTYYLFHNELRPGWERVGVMMRSKNIRGPYEEKEVLHNAPGAKEREPNQGSLVQTEAGDWWFITHQGRGGYEGRPAHLLPVTWKDGWPVPGVVDATGAGNLMWSSKKPLGGFPIAVPQSDDEFEGAILGPQWEWNYQPRPEKWSLNARPGYLRLQAFKPVRKGNFFKAGNTLTQRIMGYEGGEVVLKIHVWGMADGQKAGLCFYWSEACRLGISQQSGIQTLELVNGGNITPGPPLKSSAVWLKAAIDDQGVATFAFSLDGKKYISIGAGFKFGWHNYRGTRVGIYSYNDDADAGYVDVDFFHYRYSGPHRPATLPLAPRSEVSVPKAVQTGP